MNAAVTIMQSINWKERSFEDWLRQFGVWCDYYPENKRMIVKSTPDRKLTQEQREWLIAEYMIDGERISRVHRKTKSCLIDDNEARAVQKLWLDMRETESEVLQGWLQLVWSHYVEGKSLRQISEESNYPLISVRQDIKCGLSHLSGRNPHLRFDLMA